MNLTHQQLPPIRLRISDQRQTGRACKPSTWNADSFNSISKGHSQLDPKNVHNNHSLLLCISLCLLCRCMASVETPPPYDLWRPGDLEVPPPSPLARACVSSGKGKDHDLSILLLHAITQRPVL